MYGEILDTLKSKNLSELSHSEMATANKLARDILRADYWRDIRSIADEVKRVVQDEEIQDRDELVEWIDQMIDSHQRCIYTSQSMETLLVSVNQDACVDEFGTEGIVKDGSIQYNALAFQAIRQDLIEHLSAVGIDVNDWSPGDKDEDESTTESGDPDSDTPESGDPDSGE